MDQKAFIWDLDGTLLDSYHVIVSGLHDALAENGVELDPAEIYRRSIRTSVGEFLEALHQKVTFDMERVSVRNKELSRARVLDITLMEHAAETLEQLAQQGCRHFVYTHKGVTATIVLQNLQIDRWFEEVVSGLSGFPRKPQPHALNYLVDKYGLDPMSTYYVGDRSLDMECAANAGVRSILYLPPASPAVPTGKETFVVSDLLEIPKLF